MRSIIFISMLLLCACESGHELKRIRLQSLQGESERIDPTKSALTIIYFLSPECPLCVNYSQTMSELHNSFGNDSVKFYGVFSSNYYSSEEVETYQTRYGLNFQLFLDEKNQLATALGASVTPEVFVLNRDGKIVYSGMIDNWVNELGKKKFRASEHYLKNALEARLAGKSINPKHTEPIGCLIE